MNVETTIRRSLLLTAALGAMYAGTASADEDERTVATTCLRRTDIRTTKILSNRNILFITRDRTTYINQFAAQCLGMQRNAVLSFSYANNGSLCAGSLFTVLFRASPNSNLQPFWDPFTQKPITLQGPAFTTGPTCEIGIFSPISE